MISLPELVRTRRVIVCAGSGGVGKTTTATALAFAAAREGRKVLALTVDPSKRLAQTLGVDRNNPSPVSVSADRLKEASVTSGSLEAWMLDPAVVADRVVERLADTPEEAAKLQQNRVYRQLSRLVAGTQEYMAMEALHRFLEEGRYDLVVLDTPPSRNALDFLVGPAKMAAFLDGRIFQLFLPGEKKGFFRAAASQLLNRVNQGVFGEETWNELQEFFGTFSGIMLGLNRNAGAMIGTLKDPNDVGFVLVTSPAAEAMAEAFFFRKECAALSLPFRGFVLNRSEACVDHRVPPDASLFGGDPTPVQASALRKLSALARLEMAQVDRDRKLMAELQREVGADGFVVPLPVIAGGANDMGPLLGLADVLMR